MRLHEKNTNMIERIKSNKIITKIIRVTNYEGFYLVLFICFCIVTAAAVWMVKANVDRIANMNNNDKIQLVQENPNDVPISTDDAGTIKPVIKEGEENNEDNSYTIKTEENSKALETVSHKENKDKVVSNSPALMMPVEGNILMKYSEDSLVYSKTLDQYIVHKGIDIEAPLNAPVCAAADGTIIKIEEDSLMGITIWIEHNNDLVTIYSNLSTKEMVSEGDKVQRGDVISGVGDTALMEALEVPHLHFEVLRNNHHENPVNHLE